jgi:adenine phosphoribosyltransferase
MRLSAICVISISNIDIIVYQYISHRTASSILLFFDNFRFSFDILRGSRHFSRMTDNSDLAALIRDIPDYPKPGILFRDVSTLLLDGPGFRATIDRLAAMVAPDTELIAGIEARGFIVAAGLSYALGLGKLMLRKPGKLPGEKIGTDYALEYGTDRIEMHVGHVRPGQKVVLVDDLIATGGTAMAGVDLITQGGGVVQQALFIVDLPELGGAAKLEARGIAVGSLIGFDGH